MNQQHQHQSAGCLKRIVYPKNTILSSFTHPPVVLDLYECPVSKVFWRMWETEQVWGTIDFHNVFFSYYESQCCPKNMPGYKLSSKYLPLRSAEQRNEYRFGTTWGWVNYRIKFFRWTIPLITHHFILILIELNPGWFWKNTLLLLW